MKKVTLVTLLAIMFTGVIAQQRREVKRSKTERTEKSDHNQRKPHGKKQYLARQLNLTEEQRSKAKSISADFRKKMQELNKKEDITVKQQRDQRELLIKEHKAQLQNLLTAEQKAKAAHLKAEKLQKKEAHHDKQLEKLKTKINLTDDQVLQIKAQREAAKAKVKSIKEDQTLSRTQRKEKLDQLKETLKADRQKILNEEQKKKLEEMKKKHTQKPVVK